MVGDDGAGNQVGMAPGARWIGCRNMDRGVGTPVTYAECYQWFLAPTDLQGQNPRPDLAPDVINNSWGCPPNEGCTDPQILKTAVENLRAAGILSIHSAGNEGPSCGSVSTPGAIYDASFTVGATSDSDGIASFSSRGPVFVDGSGRPKPDVTAPGVRIRSSTRGGGYSTLQGTSMAGPHVAGLVALLISANPALAGQVDLLEEIIRDSSVPIGSTGSCGDTAGQVPNNTFGWGRIDAWAAINASPRLAVVKRASAAVITAGEVLTYTLDLNHLQGAGPIHSVVMTDVLPLNTTFISATLPHTFDGKLLRWDFPILEADESISVEITVQVPVTATGTIENVYYGAASDAIAALSGDPVVTVVGHAYYFPLLFKQGMGSSP
jgi:uncharacterized repeat protein (TIGR01451 family)